MTLVVCDDFNAAAPLYTERKIRIGMLAEALRMFHSPNARVTERNAEYFRIYSTLGRTTTILTLYQDLESILMNTTFIRKHMMKAHIPIPMTGPYSERASSSARAEMGHKQMRAMNARQIRETVDATRLA